MSNIDHGVYLSETIPQTTDRVSDLTVQAAPSDAAEPNPHAALCFVTEKHDAQLCVRMEITERPHQL